MPAGQAQYGVQNFNGDRLRVRNGTIKDFASGGILHFAGYGVFENLRILSNGQGLAVGTHAQVRNNTVANNTGGINCAPCVVEQNIITGNGFGFAGGLHVGEGAVVLGNVIVGNQGVGLWSIAGASASSGYGNNILLGNNAGGAQAGGNLIQLHPNACEPACP